MALNIFDTLSPESSSFEASSPEDTTRETRINMEEIVNLEQPVGNPNGPVSTIFKVPKRIREVNPKAYDPVDAFVGPFHHCPYCWSSVMQDPGMQTKSSCGHFDSTSAMQKCKWRCVWHLLSRLGNDKGPPEELLEGFLVMLKKKNDAVRRCYYEELPMNDGKLASIMLVDGCFIIYLMLNWTIPLKMTECSTIETEEGNVDLNINEKDKLPAAGQFAINFVLEDLLKLENQIPFFIIQLLFNCLSPCHDENIDLVNLALDLFKDIQPEESRSFRQSRKKPPSEYHHLLHLFYSSRIPSPEKLPPEPPTPGYIHGAIERIESKLWKKTKSAIDRQMSKGKKDDDAISKRTPTSKPKWIPSAKELHRAGVKFQKNEQPPGSVLNITFNWTKMKFMPLLSSGRMEIPPLQIYDYTDHLFHNLIAFEQCYPHTEMDITRYALFLNCIINQAEDVRLLQSKGILEHGLGNDQAVADLFKQLRSQIYSTRRENYLRSQIDEINMCYYLKYDESLIELRQQYFRNPWTTISVLAAIFLLLLTVEQAVFSALSYFRSP